MTTAAGATLHGDELRSVRRLVEWHVKSGKDSNELVTVATVR